MLKSLRLVFKSGLEAAQKELAAAIESGDAQAQVEANKRIATLAFENAKLKQAKEGTRRKVTGRETCEQPREMESPKCHQNQQMILKQKPGLQKIRGLELISHDLHGI